ncbi:DoxX family protein [Stieleria tagensis]|uniref:DoxX family protein n=1 Tax=Stieleria tagensis TaxID=2956795 RepID=UPI0021BC6ACF|nr:DoxX family protein [Stieleria tagensis]
MGSKKMRVAGWIISGLVAAMLIGPSAMGKFTEWEGKEEMFEHLGYSADVIRTIGVVEIAVAVLFLIPRTSFVGAILLAGYLGGATATHVRVGDPFFVPIIIGVVAWIGLGLRRPEIFQLALGQSPNRHAEG